MKLTISTKTLKTVMDVIDYTVEEITVNCDSEGVKIRFMDYSHVSLTDMFFPPQSLIEYSSNGNERFAFRVENFVKILKRAGKSIENISIDIPDDFNETDEHHSFVKIRFGRKRIRSLLY